LDIIPLPAEERTSEDESPLDFTQYESPVDTKDPTTDEEEPEPDSDEEMADTNMNGAKELGLMKPKPFTGKRSKVESFLEDCDVYLELNSKVYDTDAKKVGFVLSLMDLDEALLWKRQFLKSIKKDGKRTWPKAGDFADLVLKAFKPENVAREAIHKLEQL
jgi:hypothetical protein